MKIKIPLLIDLFHNSGGLSEEVESKVLKAAFIPFGEVVDIQIPMDYETGYLDATR